jgi:hypothetical protein
MRLLALPTLWGHPRATRGKHQAGGHANALSGVRDSVPLAR